MSGAPGDATTDSPANPALWAWPLAALFTVAGVAFHLRAPGRYVGIFLGLYLPSIALAGIGCLPWRRAARPETRPTMLSRPILAALTIAILGLATFLRVHRLGSWPPPNGTSFEEAQLGQEASRLLHEGAIPNEHMLAIGSPAAAFAIGGASLRTLRAPFMLAAVLTPFALYAAARRLLARELALVVTALLAVSWWSVAAGRIADELFFPVVLTPLAVLWLADFGDTARPSSAFLLALVSGVLVYEYTGYHIVPVLVLAYGLVAAAVHVVRFVATRDGEPIGRALRRWGPGVFVLALVWTDLSMRQVVGDTIEGRRYFIEGFARHGDAGCGIRARPREQWPEYVRDRMGALWQSGFASEGGAAIPKLGFAGRPLFDRGAAAVLLGGLALLALTPWRRFHLLLAAWIGGSVAASTLFPCEVNPHRYFTILPIALLAAGLGWQVLWDRLRGGRRGALLAVLGLAAGASAWSNVGHLQRALFAGTEPWSVFDEPSTRLSLWMAGRERDALVWVVSDLFEHLGQPNDYYWLLDGRRAVTAASLVDVVPSPERSAGPLYYLLIAKTPQPGVEALLASRYPGVERLDTRAIGVSGMDVQAFRVSSPLPDAPPLDGFAANYATSRQVEPGPDLSPPADAQLVFARREPVLSSLAIPLALKKRSVEESQQGTYLWCAWRGAIESDTERDEGFRLYAHGGEAWARVDDGPPVRISAAQGQEESQSFRASLRPGANRVALLYRFGTWEMVGAQLYRVAPDGSERILAAPVRDGHPLRDPIGAVPGRVEVTMARRLYAGAFEVPPRTELVFAVPAGVRAVEGMVGLNDGQRGCKEASLRFELRAPTGERLADSGRVDVERPQAALRADVTGRSQVVLAVSDAGDGDACDTAIVGGLTGYERP
jgi:hypothetical protein